MSEIAPTFETIFTEEYWGDIQTSPPTPACKAIPRKVYKEMKSLTSQAASAIFEGNPSQPVPKGAVIDISGDSLHTTPGTVLLADIESVMPLPFDMPSVVGLIDYRRLPCFQMFIYDEAELMSLPATLFKRNSVHVEHRKSSTNVVLPYTKYVIDREHNALYNRAVRLIAYGTDKQGEPTYRMITSWSAAHKNGVEGQSKKHDKIKGLLPEFSVGESYAQLNDRAAIRVKSAEICLSGTIEYSKAKKAKRVHAGRLATSASFASANY